MSASPWRGRGTRVASRSRLRAAFLRRQRAPSRSFAANSLIAAASTSRCRVAACRRYRQRRDDRDLREGANFVSAVSLDIVPPMVFNGEPCRGDGVKLLGMYVATTNDMHVTTP